jgi:ferredoxin
MVNTYKIRLVSKEHNLDSTFNIPADKFILEAAEDNNIELPYSCRAGSCSTCLGKVLEGSVDQADQSFLDEDQIANGFVLTCVAYLTKDSTISTHEEENLY